MQKEAKEQEKLFNVCRYIKECEFMFHVPNGGSRNLLEAVNLKKQGVKPGVSDVILLLPKGKYHYLCIEIKCGKNKPTKEQKKFIEYVNSVGGCAVVCYGCNDAINVIKKYLKGDDLDERSREYIN